MAEFSAVATVSSDFRAQLQQQQAQRLAERAGAAARSLRAQASQAQATAERAQQNARDLRIESGRADNAESRARLNLSSLAVQRQTSGGIEQLQSQVREVLAADNPPSPTAVINAYGQTTGTLIDVSA